MARQHIRRKAKRTRPAKPPIRDPGAIRAMDSEDQSGTYAPANSSDDTGESDEGVFAQGPPSSRTPPRPLKRRTGG